MITVRRVSGTIKKAEEELLRRDKTALDSTKGGSVAKKA
jgi:RNase P/RNase MRP subunit POP5